MLELPHYFTQLETIIPLSVVELLVSIEHSFYRLNYNEHIDDIDSVFTDYSSQSNKDIGATILSFYRQHLDNVCILQGIYLNNPLEDSLSQLTEFLLAVTKIGLTPVKDLLEGEVVNDENSADLYFASVIALISNLPIVIVLKLIHHLSDEVVDYLKQDIPLIYLKSKHIVEAETRFKNSPLLKEGIVVDEIRQMASFGYSIYPFIKSHGLLFANITSNEQLADEIILLVLGSNTTNETVETMCYELAEHLSNSTQQLLQLNTLIKTYFKANPL